MKTVFIPLVGVAGLFALLYLGLGLDPRKVPSALLHKPAPAFDLPVLGDNTDRRVTDAALKGQVTLMNVWASWCVSCRHEHPLLVALARSTNIDIVGLNYKDEPADALRWLAALGDPYRLSMVDKEGRAGIDWGVYGVPETFVVDAEGIVRMKHIGPLTASSLKDKVLPLVRRLEASGG
ncbi:MAG: DsbE family thiol:disulfide interchange protein [Gammaproteobacteria bacterium]|nr:DsbE family thiol:disulfide interchange protein [Gammaproteobacteria bacterium]